MGEDQRRQLAFRDQRAGDHRLAGSGRGDEHAVVASEHRRDCLLLLRRQLAVELERQPFGCRPPILDHEPATGACNRLLGLGVQAARKVEVGQVFLVAADQPRRLVGGEA